MTTMHNQDNFVRTANMDTARLKAITSAVWAADLNLQAWYGHFAELSGLADWATEMGCATVTLTHDDLERLHGIQKLLERKAEKTLRAAQAEGPTHNVAADFVTYANDDLADDVCKLLRLKGPGKHAVIINITRET